MTRPGQYSHPGVGHVFAHTQCGARGVEHAVALTHGHLHRRGQGAQGHVGEDRQLFGARSKAGEPLHHRLQNRSLLGPAQAGQVAGGGPPAGAPNNISDPASRIRHRRWTPTPAGHPNAIRVRRPGRRIA